MRETLTRKITYSVATESFNCIFNKIQIFFEWSKALFYAWTIIRNELHIESPLNAWSP